MRPTLDAKYSQASGKLELRASRSSASPGPRACLPQLLSLLSLPQVFLFFLFFPFFFWT